jgi:hypothetical protein
LRSWENLDNDEKKGILQATYAWRNRGWDSDWNTGKAKRDRNNQLTLKDNDEFFSDLLEKNPEIHPDYVDPDTGVTHDEIIDVYNDYGKEEVVDAIYGEPTSDDLEDIRLGTDWGLEPVGPYGSEPDVVPSEQDVIDQYYEDMTGNISIDDIKKFIAGEKNKDTDGSLLSSGRTGGGFANPQTSNEIRRIVETNEEIENAARYVGLDDYETGTTSRDLG